MHENLDGAACDGEFDDRVPGSFLVFQLCFGGHWHAGHPEHGLFRSVLLLLFCVVGKIPVNAVAAGEKPIKQRFVFS
jgi:hypothetical protein